MPQSSGLPALVGARAAVDMREFGVAESLLARPDASVSSLTVPRLMLEADMALAQDQPGVALDKLAELRREAGLHTAALRLEVRALTAARRFTDIPPIVDQLVKRKVYDAGQGDMLRATAHAEALTAFRSDANGLRAYWSKLSDTDRTNPKVARAGATAFLSLGGDREAADIIARCLERNWDADLARAVRASAASATRRASSRRRNAGSRRTTRMRRSCTRWVSCASASRCGARRRRTSRRALRSTDHWRVRVTLGELHARLGRSDLANMHLAAALKALVGQQK